jgi:hypothetical protein
MPIKRKGGKAAYNREGHDKCPKGSHRVGSNGLHHSHVVLRVLCLDCIRLVIGDFRFLIEIVGMFDWGDVSSGLDLCGVAIDFRIDRVTHVGWCLPG